MQSFPANAGIRNAPEKSTDALCTLDNQGYFDKRPTAMAAVPFRFGLETNLQHQGELRMRRFHPFLSAMLLGAAMVTPALTVGCGDHHYYRAYDADHGDYHSWNNNETVYYQQWETENHYDHKDFKVRNKDEQKQYFDWKHKHQDDKDKH